MFGVASDRRHLHDVLPPSLSLGVVWSGAVYLHLHGKEEERIAPRRPGIWAAAQQEYSDACMHPHAMHRGKELIN